MFARRALAATVLATTLVAACGGSDEPAAGETVATPAPAEQPAAEPSPTEAPAVPAALDITAPLIGGGEIELGQYAGRPVLLWFWAPW